jgi:hypothetical protein
MKIFFVSELLPVKKKLSAKIAASGHDMSSIDFVMTQAWCNFASELRVEFHLAAIG